MPKFQKRHYEVVARALREVRSTPYGTDISSKAVLDLTEDALMEVFKSDNPNFDRTRFKEACLP